MKTADLLKFRSSLVVVVILSLIHLLKISLAAPHVLLDFYRLFGLSLSGFLDGGIWSVLTYGFLHEGWFHFSINTLFILVIGACVEQRLGWKVWWRIVIAGVMFGGVFHLLTSVWYLYHGETEQLLIGISGACYALLLALTTLHGDRRLRFIPVSAKNLALGAVISQILLLLMSPALALPGFAQMGESLVMMGVGDLFRSSFSCHLGGAFAGWLIVSIHMRKNLR